MLNKMKDKLSSESLYHFTSKLKNIISIIENGFEHHLVPEELPLTGYENMIFSLPGIVVHKFEFSAVCFSDIPFRFIKDHIEQYGEYGISLKKEWGMKNKVTPIRYVHYDTPEFKTDSFYNILNSIKVLSQYDSRMSNLFSTILEYKNTCDKFSKEDWDNLPEKFQILIDRLDGNFLDVFNYFYKHLGLLRNYKGPWRDRKTGKVSERLFYDEKEWRSIKTNNEQTNLIFEYDDIINIYIKNDEERKSIISSFLNNKDHLKIDDYSDIEQKVLLIDEEIKKIDV